MQRKSYAALFAALVIGIGAIDVDAAEVRSVTVTAPDSGKVLGIGDEFKVEVVVRDFTPDAEDGVLIALLSAPDSLLADGGHHLKDARGDGDGTGNPPDSYADSKLTAVRQDEGGYGDKRGFDHPTLHTTNETIGLNDGTDGGNDKTSTNLTRQGGVAGEGIVAVRIRKGNGNQDSTKYWGGDAISVAVNEAYGDPEEVLYTWTGKIHVSSTDGVSGIRAAAVPVDKNDTGEASVTAGTIARSSTSKGSKLFAIDAERPLAPAELIDGGFDRTKLNEILLGRSTATDGDNTRHYVAGIGDFLRFKVRVGPSRMPLLLEQDHKVVIEFNPWAPDNTNKPNDLDEDPDLLPDLLGVAKKSFSVSLGGRDLDTLKFEHEIRDGDFGDLVGHKVADADDAARKKRIRATAYIVDKVGNRSRDATADGDYTVTDAYQGTDNLAGEWVDMPYLLDGKAPVIDGVSGKAGSDTLHIASPDTVTDGTQNDGFKDDDNAIVYKLFEDLSLLEIDLGGTKLNIKPKKAIDRKQTVDANGLIQINEDDPPTISSYDTLSIHDGNSALRQGNNIRVVLVAGEKANLTTVNFSTWAGKLSSATISDHDTTGLGALKTGVKTVKVTGTDLAGNKGPAAVRADVYVDVDDLAFNGLFPTGKAVKGKIEEETANVRFTLSEHADSVLLTYAVKSAAKNGPERNGEKKIRALVGGELLDTEEQIIYHDEFINTKDAKKDTGLVHGTKYKLTLLGADLAGNYALTDAGEMTYDTSYVVPQITSFKIVTDPAKQGGTLKDNQIAAGAKVNFTITAQHDDKTAALTYGKAEDYNNDAMLVVSGGSGEGLKLTGKGVITEGMPMGTAALSKRAWGLGVATATLEATVAHETHTVTIHDSSLAASPYVGKLDSVLVIADLVTAKIMVDVDSTAQMGEEFQVGLSFVDKYGNLNNDLNTFVQVGTGAIGLDVPTLVPVTNGTGSFSVRSNEHLGELTLTVRDVGPVTGGPANNPTTTTAATTLTITAAAPPPDPVAPDGPNEVVGDDYKGVAGRGDQGGFIVLTWDVSDDHATIDRYRIWREILVNRDVVDGKIVELDPPELRNVSWATVGAIPGETVMRVVVATLDPDSTRWGVSAERGGLVSEDGSDADDGMDGDGTADTTMTDTTMADTTMADTTMTDTSGTSTKRAFMAMQSLSVPYELMAKTMVRSRQAAGDGASMATLTPEALAFERGGLVPNLKATGSITFTAQAVAATDDIPPAPVTGLTAMDTPGDAGASITIEWTPSVDDKVLTSMVADAVGTNGNVYTTAGVAGYKVSRRLGDGAWTEAGTAPAGSRMFEDQNVDNGVRYSYKVEAFDLNNLTPSEEVQSAMAIRNTVVDKDGQRIVGLFGADDAVGFDDFFIFADHIGLTSDNDLFEAAFDLNGDKVINTADFFAFAESFGKVVEASGKAVPTRAGLNSEARFSMAAGTDLPLVGEEMSLRVSLEDFAEVRGYGFTVHFDESYLEFVEPRVESNPLGETALSQPRVISKGDGELHIAAFGETAVDEGDLGLSLVFRTVREIEESLVEIMAGDIQDGSYGLTRLTDPVSVRIETRPEVYALENNYPNPFNPETTLKYQLPDANEVTLEVFNMLGQVVRTLVDREFQNAGRYTYRWDATNDGGQPLSSGIYFYRVTAGGEFQSHKKMLLLK